jgi:hypothetical protein
VVDNPEVPNEEPEEEPRVFGVDFETNQARFTHRRFVELIAASSAALGVTLAGCSPPGASPSPTPLPTPPPTSSPDASATPEFGTVPPGIEGEELQVDGITMWAKCGTYIPAGTLCMCNCVTGSQACTCDSVCSCNSHTTCTCVGVCSCAGDTGGGSHYWYPN